MRILIVALYVMLAQQAHADEILSLYSLRQPANFTTSSHALGQVITYELVPDGGKERIMPSFKGAEVYTFDLGANQLCKSFTANFFGNVSHPEGNRGGRLNERADGYGINCYLNEARGSGLFVYGMTNSQFKPTFAVGARVGVTLFEWGGLKLDAGVGGTFVAYERANNRFTYGVIPMRYEKLSYAFALPWRNIRGSLSITQDHLLPAQIRLRGMEANITMLF